jgi:hypothetical protein
MPRLRKRRRAKRVERRVRRDFLGSPQPRKIPAFAKNAQIIRRQADAKPTSRKRDSERRESKDIRTKPKKIYSLPSRSCRQRKAKARRAYFGFISTGRRSSGIKTDKFQVNCK